VSWSETHISIKAWTHTFVVLTRNWVWLLGLWIIEEIPYGKLFTDTVGAKWCYATSPAWIWLGPKLSAVTGFLVNLLVRKERKRHTLLYTHSLSVVQKNLLSPVSPAVMEVELWRESRGLSDRALLSSTWCRLGGCCCRRAGHCLVCLSCCLARLSRCLTRLSGCLAWLRGHLAWLGASLAWLGYRTGLGLRAVFMGHRALFLWAGPRMGTCNQKKGISPCLKANLALRELG